MKGAYSIETTQGIAIICILFVNTINYWLSYNYDLSILFSFLILIFDILGASLFIFIFSFSVIFTVKKKMGCPPDRKNRNKVFRQGLILIFLGVLYNLLYSFIEYSGFLFWGWNILMFIGFGQFFCYYSFKLVRWARFTVSVIIILATPYILELLYIMKDTNNIASILHFVFVSPIPIFPILPFASIWFMITVFAELTYELKMLESKTANLEASKFLVKNGFIFIIISFLYSLLQFFPFLEPFSYNPSKYPFIDAVPILRGSSIIYIPGLPEFMVKGTLQNIFFILGICLIIFGLIYYIINFNGVESRIIRIFRLYGRNSITLLFLQWPFLLLFDQSLITPIFFSITLIYLILIGFILNLWNKYGKLKFSLEWFIRKGSKKTFNETI